jgi:hypothetical protein
VVVEERKKIDQTKFRGGKIKWTIFWARNRKWVDNFFVRAVKLPIKEKRRREKTLLVWSRVQTAAKSSSLLHKLKWGFSLHSATAETLVLAPGVLLMAVSRYPVSSLDLSLSLLPPQASPSKSHSGHSCQDESSSKTKLRRSFSDREL